MYQQELQKLKGLYHRHCFDIPMYADKVAPTAFDCYENFITIPFSYKQEIRNSSVFQRTTSQRDEVYGIFSSSGTTGTRTYYVYNKKDKVVHEEFVRTFYTELGITPGDLGGIFAPVDAGVMAHTMMWQFTTMGAGYVNCPEPSPHNMMELVQAVPVTVIATRPDIASTVAYFTETRVAAANSAVKKLIVGGGFLSEGRRKLLERTWNAECFNMYGMSEIFGPIAGECRKKNGQHYLSDYLLIELIDPDTMLPVPEGQPGIAVYTTLWDKGFPLLRYWSDDLMHITWTCCDCGSKLPRFYHLGRMGDCIKIKDKFIFPVNVEELLFEQGFIFDYQVNRKGNEILVTIEHPEVPEDTRILQKKLETLFGQAITLRFVSPGKLGYLGHGKRFYEE